MRNLTSSELNIVSGGMRQTDFETIYVSTFDPWSLFALVSERSVSADNGYFDASGGGAVGGSLAHTNQDLSVNFQKIASVYGTDVAVIASQSSIMCDLVDKAAQRGVVFTADNSITSQFTLGTANTPSVININVAQLLNDPNNIVSSLAHELGHAVGHPMSPTVTYATRDAFVNDGLTSEAYAAIAAIDVSRQLDAKGIYIPIGQQDPTSRTAINSIYDQYRTSDPNRAIQLVADIYRNVELDHDADQNTPKITYEQYFVNKYP